MVSDPGLFQLRRSLLLPRRAEATNLAVTTAVSATHVVFSSIRMEPQWMVNQTHNLNQNGPKIWNP